MMRRFLKLHGNGAISRFDLRIRVPACLPKRRHEPGASNHIPEGPCVQCARAHTAEVPLGSVGVKVAMVGKTRIGLFTMR
jgi:hypothetical protein